MAYNIIYTLINDDNEYQVSGYEGTPVDIQIPSIYNKKPVTSIGASAFLDCTSLEKITLGNNIQTIFQSAFARCTSLADVILPNSLQIISASVFAYCRKLKNIELPRSLNLIGNYAFSSCSSLEEVMIPDGVTQINSSVFNNCEKLKRIVIPNSITNISGNAFLLCPSLTEVVLLPTTPPTIQTSSFSKTDNITFYCHSASLAAYKNTSNWVIFKDNVVADDLKFYFTIGAMLQKKSFIGRDEIDTLAINSSLNLENGDGSTAIQQLQDQEQNVQQGYFNFRGKNAYASFYDPDLNQELPYGGTGNFSAVFGGKAAAMGKRAFAAGTTTIAKGDYSFAFGNATAALGSNSSASGAQTTASGSSSSSRGRKTLAHGEAADAAGDNTIAYGRGASAEGHGVISIVNGELNFINSRGVAYGDYSHVEGYDNIAEGPSSHAQGNNTRAAGDSSHSEGGGSFAKGDMSHAGGKDTSAYGHYSFSGGNLTYAIGDGSFAIGNQNQALGTFTFANGYQSYAHGDYTFVNGIESLASYYNSAVFGYKTQDGRKSQLICGEFNVGKSDTLFEVGNGYEKNNPSTGEYIRQNAFEVLQDGSAKVGRQTSSADDVLVLVTKGYVDALEQRIKALEDLTGATITKEEITEIFAEEA